ncbi:hypothetical protein E2320_014082, partial [Naja naja]
MPPVLILPPFPSCWFCRCCSSGPSSSIAGGSAGPSLPPANLFLTVLRHVSIAEDQNSLMDSMAFACSGDSRVVSSAFPW